MRQSVSIWIGGGLLVATIGLRAGLVTAEAQKPAAAPAAPSASAALDYNELVQTYCGDCHNDQLKRGNVSFDTFDIAKVGEQRGTRREDDPQAAGRHDAAARRGAAGPATYAALISTLEAKADAAAAGAPESRRAHLPQTEPHGIPQLDSRRCSISTSMPAQWLPLDQKSANFDNIADEQTISATLLESYLNAASEISRLAVGDRNAPPVDRTYTNTSYVSQHPWDRLEGAPIGSRGGMVVSHIFPVDAEYVFEVTFTGGDNTRLEDLDLSLNGERVALVRYETRTGGRGRRTRRGADEDRADSRSRPASTLMSAAFVRRFEGPYEDLIRPHDWSFAGGGSGGAGITTLPHLRDVIVHGPFKADAAFPTTASRKKIFTCRPTSAAEERPCARTIVSHLAMSAYRRPVDAARKWTAS